MRGAGTSFSSTMGDRDSEMLKEEPDRKWQFQLGERVRKTKGSSWRGRVRGAYSTELTPFGYVVESEREPGSVHVYPGYALEAVPEDER